MLFSLAVQCTANPILTVRQPVPQMTAQRHHASLESYHAPSSQTPWDYKAHSRIGEAAHPGPILLEDDFEATPDQSIDPTLLQIGCSNTAGLRQKEPQAISLGPGIWAYTETQLSSITQPNCAARLRALAHQQQRHLRVFAGAPARLRSRSQWAGSWTGVLITSDIPAHVLKLPLTQEVHESGRILTTRHLLSDTQIQIATIYGFPKGPTYPQAFALTSHLLEVVTTELVIGSSGCRVVLGDLNADPDQLEVFDTWRRYGWESLQTSAHTRFNWSIQATCKGARERDQIWLSPEAQSLVAGLQHQDIFADHSTLSVFLRMPTASVKLLSWPKPSRIPWE